MLCFAFKSLQKETPNDSVQRFKEKKKPLKLKSPFQAGEIEGLQQKKISYSQDALPSHNSNIFIFIMFSL